MIFSLIHLAKFRVLYNSQVHL